MDNIIDLSNFLEVVGDDLDLKKELFDEFISVSEANLAAMEIAITLSDQAGWQKNVHLLKGSSQNLGAVTLASYASKAENELDKVLWPEILDQMKILYSGVKDFLLR